MSNPMVFVGDDGERSRWYQEFWLLKGVQKKQKKVTYWIQLQQQNLAKNIPLNMPLTIKKTFNYYTYQRET